MLRQTVVVVTLVLGAVPPTRGADPPSPRAIVRQVRRAVDGDSAAALIERWTAALARDPADRAAALGLATIARLEYRYDEADGHYRTLVAPAGTAGDAIATYARLGLAWGLDTRGLARRADSAFTLARTEARARHDRAAEGEALIGVSINRGSQQGVRVGLALLDTASRLVPAAAVDLVADIAVRRALFATVLSRPSAARDAVAAAALAQRAGEPRLVAKALRALALGLELSEQGDSSAAVLAEVERIELATHDRASLSETLMRHGDVFHNRGDLGPYRRYALAARDEALASGNFYALAASNIGLTALALLLNDDVAAGHFLSVAEAQYDSMQDSSGYYLARSYEAELAGDVGDWPRARTLAEAVRAFDHKIGDPAEIEQWRDLVEIDIRAGDLPAADRALDSAAALAHARHMPQWDAGFDLDRGRVALAHDDPAGAVTALTRHLRGLDTAEHVVRYTSRALLAEAEARNGQLAAAELELTAAADELDAWRSTITDRALRPFVFQVSSRELNDRDASVAAVLAAMAAGGRERAAFALGERRRARDLADRLVRLAALRNVPGAGPGTPARTGDTLTGDIAVRASGEPGSADSVGASLPDSHTALLEYVTGARGTPTTLFVVARGRVAAGLGVGRAALHAFVLPSADSLAVGIARFVALIESGHDAGALARSLGAATLDSAFAVLGPEVTRLIIVPDGPLYRMPFDALRTAGGTPVVEHYAVSVAPSAAVLRAIWRQRPAASADTTVVRILALADPAFASDRAGPPGAAGAAAGESAGGGRRGADRDEFESAGGLPRLVESGHEAEVVARYGVASEVRVGRDASAAYLLHAPLGRFRVIHIATHALVDERSIARTALVLAPGGGESGFVTPSDLAALRLRADLVVLSACQTAGGVVIDGEGMQGLTGPLLEAGAQSVVATQWRIRDRATVPFIESFYAALAHGLPVGDALRAAKRSAIARGAPAADWAAFTVVGDPLARVPLRSPPLGRAALAGWLVAVLAILVAVGAAARIAVHARRSRRLAASP
jgi:CHAT domain-containing protein